MKILLKKRIKKIARIKFLFSIYDILIKVFCCAKSQCLLFDIPFFNYNVTPFGFDMLNDLIFLV